MAFFIPTALLHHGGDYGMMLPMNRKWLLIVGVLLGVGIWGYLQFTQGDTVDNGPTQATATVRRGDLVVFVRGDGELRSAKKSLIANETHRSATIKKLIAEGARVTKGQLVVEFESRDLMDTIETVETSKTNADNKVLEASERLELTVKEQAHKLNKTVEALTTATDNLKRYTDGELPLRRQELSSRIALAEQKLLQAKEKLAFKLKVNADKRLQSPYSENEIKAERISVQQLEFDLQKAGSDQKLLEEFDKPQEIRKRKSAIKDAEMALEKAKVEQRTQLRIATSQKTTAEANLERIVERLTELKEEAAKLIVYAESDGLVSYDTGRSHYRSDPVTVEIGAVIKSKQRIMVIPDISTLQVRFRVYEAMIRQVHLDQKAIIRVGSRPKETFTGKVIKIDTLPSSEDAWRNPGVKIFNVLVQFDSTQDLEGLRPGGTANVTVETSRLRDALIAPLASVFARGGQTWCIQSTPDGPLAVNVKIGKLNDTSVQVLTGLSEGDQVLLALPEGFSLPVSKSKPKPVKPKRPRPSGNPSETTRPSTAPASKPAQPAKSPAPAATKPA